MGKTLTVNLEGQLVKIIALYFSHMLASILVWALNPFTVFIMVSLVTALIVFAVAYFVIKISLIKKLANMPFVIFEVLPLQITEQSAFTTSQFFNSIHGLSRDNSFLYRFFGVKREYSFEIVSTKEDGIRYLIRVPEKDASILKKNILSYLPGTQVKEVDDYIPKDSTFSEVIEFKLSNHFAFPLRKQAKLEEYDPIAYITGSMTKLNKNEAIVFQVLTSPVKKSEIKDIKKISNLIYSEKDLVSSLKSIYSQSFVTRLLKFVILNLIRILTLPIGLFMFVMTGGREGPFLKLPEDSLQKKTNNPYQEELEQRIKEKLDQELFNITLRLYIKANSLHEVGNIKKGFVSVLSSYGNSGYQSLVVKKSKLNISKIKEFLLWTFSKRLSIFNSSVILSASEVADLYHFPYTSTTKTENIVKLMSRELPAPLSLKAGKHDLFFAVNNYGGSVTQIGLTEDERRRHVYILGATGTGKSTMLYP